jgi:hypothetical protein
MGSGMGLISDPWAGSRAENFAHLLIGHGFCRARPDQTRPDCQLELHGDHVLKKSKLTYVSLKKFEKKFLGVDIVEIYQLVKYA